MVLGGGRREGVAQWFLAQRSYLTSRDVAASCKEEGIAGRRPTFRFFFLFCHGRENVRPLNNDASRDDQLPMPPRHLGKKSLVSRPTFMSVPLFFYKNKQIRSNN